MSTIRFFDGGRKAGPRSIASEIMRLEVQKKGKMPTAQRFKYMYKRRMDENRKKALSGKTFGFSMPKSMKEARQMSKKAEQALKEIAMKKAAKDAKAMRQMVFIQPRVFPNGRLVQNGKIFDIAGNIVAQVNTKNGKMTTTLGWSLGKYKPRSTSTETTIQNAIDKYSPYYINLRKMQMMQQGQHGGGGVWGPDHGTINLYGHSGHGSSNNIGSGVFGDYTLDMGGPRQNVGATAWGAMSDNAWGTFTDNVWGTSCDTVWGTNTSDVWGGIGGNPYGKTVQFWGTGNGKNYLKSFAEHIATMFGFSILSRETRASIHEAVGQIRSANGAHEHAQTTRSSGSADHHVVASATTRAPTTRK